MLLLSAYISKTRFIGIKEALRFFFDLKSNRLLKFGLRHTKLKFNFLIELSEELKCFNNEKMTRKKARTANISICESRAGQCNIDYVQASAAVRADIYKFGF